MKFDIPISCFYRNISYPEAIYKIKEMGFDAAEMYGWKDLDLDALKAALDDTGVKLLSMCTTSFRLTEPAARDEWVEGVRESCEAAKKLGVKQLITQVGQDTGARRDFQHASIAAGLKKALPILEDSGVVMTIEPLNTYFNHPGYYLDTSIEGFDIVREIGSPFVKVCYDIYHQQIMEGNIIPNVTNNLSCINHLHCAGHPGRHELQYGENDYNFIFSAIDKLGYDGYC